MLSNKMTFSLITSFVMAIVFGLICFAPSVMADGDGNEFGVTITAAETMIDVSSDAGMQIASGRDRSSTRQLTSDETRQATLITLLITTNEIVNLGDPDAGVTEADLTGRSGAMIMAEIDERAKQVLDDSDIIIDAYDAEGRSLGILPLKETLGVVVISHRDPDNPGREFLVQIDESKLTAAYTAVRGGGTQLEIHTLLFSIAPGKMKQSDIAHVTAVRNNDHKHFHYNARVKVYRVDLVDDDQGNPKYNSGVSTAMMAGSGTPGVVAIKSLRDRMGFIETVPFTVRVILTEEPTGGLTPALINVRNGKATAVVKGVTLKGAHAAVTFTAADATTAGQVARPAQMGEVTTSIVSYTPMDDTDTITEPPADGTGTGTFPEATGRDNKYHQYFVTVEPAAGLTGDYVVISVKQFSDKVIPAPNMYVPLSYQQIVATTLTAAQEMVRDARVMNETLMVMATTTATVDIFKASADARLTHEKFINEKLVIPANGYLVLASGTYAQAGVLSAAAKLADKKRVGETDYNTVEKFDPPYPGSDLENFFRNGATIQLVYKNIAGNPAVADVKTGYDGASDDVYAPGTVLINEIMWGYDRGLDNRAYTEGQWIELRNTTALPISLDKQEWMLVYGKTTSFTAGIVMDTAGNDPSTGYWGGGELPGQSGVSSSDPVVKTGVAVQVEGTKEDIQILDRDIVDVISMSRVAGGTDGTAQSSWARSVLPSANFSSIGRIGTPGAMNIYDTSLQEAAVAAAAAAAAAADAVSKAPVAAGTDLMISEIMVASNEGRFPQWIEITNSSVGEVSLMGWVVSIANDSADPDVVAASLGIKLDGVTLDAGQSALVVSKLSNRNSGVAARTKDDGNAGALDSNRIVDAQSQVNPPTATYSLLSEMAFQISLQPPLTGGITDRGDVVGNLGGGWELPMSEGNRSSLIRREMNATAEIMGTDAAGWVLASDTTLGGAHRETYYGDKDDVGTPGYDAGGALPVELSGFGAKRDPLTGAVVITWATQSELNNAGFFIKRSQQKDGKFVIVNPTMIAGAGTTAEKQSYTYTDATADPNVIYYYQIEDVSLDGNRQTLTRAHRLKGHIGAAGKATTTWGELKSSRE